jgi:hypothetical protein
MPSRNTLYPVTPTSSVAAVQVRFICDEETAEAARPVGVDGAVVSGKDLVLPHAGGERPDFFPFASTASME